MFSQWGADGLGTVSLLQQSSGCPLFLLIAKRRHYSGQSSKDGQGLIHEKGTFLFKTTGTTITIQPTAVLRVPSLTSKTCDDLGEGWHDGFLVTEDERRHTAQMKMVAHRCLGTEGQHMSPGRRDRNPSRTHVFSDISMKFSGSVYNGPRKRWFHFGDVLDYRFECKCSLVTSMNKDLLHKSLLSQSGWAWEPSVLFMWSNTVFIHQSRCCLTPEVSQAWLPSCRWSWWWELETAAAGSSTGTTRPPALQTQAQRSTFLRRETGEKR